MANIFITTTPYLSNIEIKRYICPLIANVVLGVNFFSDFVASFSDFFGGKSETYENKLDILNYEVEILIKEKAYKLGANAVIDYKLSFNEISGKGKQMFMVTATGTACEIVMPRDDETMKMGQVSYSQLRRQFLVDLYLKLLKSQDKLEERDWKNILSLNLIELAEPLTKEFLRLKTLKTSNYLVVQYRDDYFAKYLEYLSRINKEVATKVISNFLLDYPDILVPLVVKFNLFSPSAVIELLDSDSLDLAIRLINAHKETYTCEDLRLMKEIVEKLDTLPDKGHYQNVKSGLFSKKEEEMYFCPNGHKNSMDSEFCSNMECGLNIKGLDEDQVRIINVFKGMVKALDKVLNKSAYED